MTSSASASPSGGKSDPALVMALGMLGGNYRNLAHPQSMRCNSTDAGPTRPLLSRLWFSCSWDSPATLPSHLGSFCRPSSSSNSPMLCKWSHGGKWSLWLHKAPCRCSLPLQCPVLVQLPAEATYKILKGSSKLRNGWPLPSSEIRASFVIL